MFRRLTFKGWLSLFLVTVAAGTLFGWAVGRTSGVSASTGTGTQAASSMLPNLPAVTQASLLADTASWPVASGSVDSVTYSFHYPPTWNASLLYCAPGAGNNHKEGGHLPTGCASTDILVGQKARDTGRLSGSTLSIGGKTARRAIESHPANVLVSQVYTTMVYDAAGTPLFGFTTQIGPATDKATLDAITATLDTMASTIKVEARR